jgi:hypothetical protein
MKGKEVETMLNMFTIVGRINEIGNDTIGVSVPDAENKTENNKIFIEIGVNMLNQIKEYCHISDLIGVKGRILNNKLVGEKVTFLSSVKNND